MFFLKVKKLYDAFKVLVGFLEILYGVRVTSEIETTAALYGNAIRTKLGFQCLTLIRKGREVELKACAFFGEL